MPNSERGWGILPNPVVRDTRLSDAALVVLAYRATYVGRYGLNENHLGTICKGNGRGHSGLGKNNARDAIGRLVELGYLVRGQPKARGGVYAYAVDRVQLPECDPLDQKRVYREWFDGTWSLEEVAAYIMIRAGLRVKVRDGNMIRLEWLSTDDLRQRFGWSKEKTLAALKALLARGRIEQEDLRENGTFRGTRYRERSFQRPAAGDGDSGQRIAGRREDERHTYESDIYVESDHTLDSVRESLPSEDSTHKNISTPSQGEGAFLGLDELEEHCISDDPLLGWITDVESSTGAEFATLRATLDDNCQDGLDMVLRSVDLDALGARLLEAADGRVAPKLRERVGAYCVAYIASFLVERGDTVEKALDTVLQAIQTSIGRRKSNWLNSYRLIGIRVLS